MEYSLCGSFLKGKSVSNPVVTAQASEPGLQCSVSGSVAAHYGDLHKSHDSCASSLHCSERKDGPVVRALA